MAMRTATPWWLSLIYVIGLGLLFAGERAFSHTTWHPVATGLGALIVVGVTALRVWATLGTRGARRRVERTLLYCHVGAGLALLLYTLTTTFGMGLIGLGDLDVKAAARFQTAMTVLWSIALIASLIPLFMIEMSMGTAKRERFALRGAGDEDEAVEYFRVRELSLSGLSVALAAAFLMVTCNVATERNVRKDVSYFKTASPGSSTRAIVQNQADVIKVLLFFPEVNEVKEEVRAYFESLNASTKKIQIEMHDRMVAASLAEKYRVTKDGVIVLIKGDKSENVEVDTDMEKARRGKSKLRNLDREVNAKLLKIVREKRKVYLTVGHGELNDPDSVAPDLKGKMPERRVSVFRRRFTDLQYEIKELGAIDLAQGGVPTDASIVVVLAPTQALQPAELEALGAYLDRGGRLLMALDPRGQASFGPLEGKLGVGLERGFVTDDKAYLRQRGGLADRRWAMTTQFSAHASTTTLSRSADKGGLLLIESGVLREKDFTTTGQKPKRTFVIRTQASSWLDLPTDADAQGNFTFDEATEKRERFPVAAAVEGPALDAEGKEKPPEAPKELSDPEHGKNEDKSGFRAVVFADGDLFADLMIQGAMGTVVQMVSDPLLDDVVKWLGGEEVFAGEVVSEEDVAIRHTKSADAVWFTLTIVGAPLLVLVLGLTGTWLRRRKSPVKAGRAEVRS
jgi:hypothetical protein